MARRPRHLSTAFYPLKRGGAYPQFFGKKTAGVDGVKKLTPKQRLTLTNGLKVTGKSKPTGRVMIPKANSDELRPRVLPTME